MIKASLLFLALAATGAATADAQESATALDLSLPPSSAPHVPVAAPAADPPGTYYGDTSGRTRSAPFEAQEPGHAGDAEVWGSVSTGIGYSRAYGNSHWSAADINVSKRFGEGGNSRMDLHISVGQSDGVTPYPYGPAPFAPLRHRSPPPGF